MLATCTTSVQGHTSHHTIFTHWIPLLPTRSPPTPPGPTKATCERTLRVVLQLEAGLEVAQALVVRGGRVGGRGACALRRVSRLSLCPLAPSLITQASGPGPIVKATLTEPFLKRLQKLGDEDEAFTEEEY